MKYNINKISYKITLILIIGLFIAGANSNAIIIDKTSSKNLNYNFDGYINISVEEAWVLLSNISNGIQFPIDVRTYGEWITERIDTPYPEFPRLYSLSDLQSGINDFKSIYTNKEVIIYCKAGSRSASAAQYLVDNEFNGTIYNILGGITSWKQVGLPIKNNNNIPNIPEKPSISSLCYVNISCLFTTISNDQDHDPLKYGWDWDNDNIIDEWTDYLPVNNSINVSHSWNLPGDYEIKVLVEDIVGEKSDFSLSLEISVINLAPEIPKIEGPISGKKGEIYQYNISTVDLNGDMVYYWIVWYDNCPGITWDGPYISGDYIIKEYSWADDGDYTIKVKAKDTNGVESDWATFEVTMPKYNIDFIKDLLNTKFVNNSFLFKILQKLIE